MDETLKDRSDSTVKDTEATGQAELDPCHKELQQAKDRYLYLNAEFDNYKKRLEKERGLWIDQTEDLVLRDVLPIVDDMNRALDGLKNQTLPPEAASHLAGFELISKALSKLLREYEVEEIPATTEFDPERFEAVMQVATDTQASGQIVAVLQKGYSRRGRVLRPAKVSVAQ